LTKLWTAEDVTKPGNTLVYPDSLGQPRIATLDNWRTIAELDGNGKLLERYTLDIPEDSPLTQLRTGVDGQGNRFFAGFSGTFKKVYLFDQQWKKLAEYPEETRDGISDVRLVDLDGDGQLELVVGYLGSVGVQAASLEAKRLWGNRDFENILSIAALDPDSDGHRRLLVANERKALGVIDHAGKRLSDLEVPEHPIDVIVAADLTGEPPVNLAALSAVTAAELIALGLDHEGTELWSYPVPVGVRGTPCDILISGRLKVGEPGQWIITGPDGSIHILSADGKPLDKFNYGDELTGIAVGEVDGKPVLLVATAKELTAWSVGPAE
jgi:hypothetical protein